MSTDNCYVFYSSAMLMFVLRNSSVILAFSAKCKFTLYHEGMSPELFEECMYEGILILEGIRPISSKKDARKLQFGYEKICVYN